MIDKNESSQMNSQTINETFILKKKKLANISKRTTDKFFDKKKGEHFQY